VSGCFPIVFAHWHVLLRLRNKLRVERWAYEQIRCFHHHCALT
jgi:hypothetical protein